MKKSDKLPFPTLGEILREEFFEPLSLSAYRAAKDLNVSTSTILDLLHDRRRLSVEMALKLARYFNTSDRFWINLQADIDIRTARETLKKSLERIQPVSA